MGRFLPVFLLSLILPLSTCSLGRQQFADTAPLVGPTSQLRSSPRFELPDSLHLAPGARVRISTQAEGRREGTLVGIDTSALLLRRDRPKYDPRDPRFARGDAFTDTIPLGTVREIRVQRPGARTARALVGAGLGIAIGLGFGGWLGEKLTDCTGCEDPGIGRLVFGPLGAILGGLVGAGLGIVSADRWEPVTLPPAWTGGSP